MGFFGAVGNAIKKVGHSLVHPGWGGPAQALAKDVGGGLKSAAKGWGDPRSLFDMSKQSPTAAPPPAEVQPPMGDQQIQPVPADGMNAGMLPGQAADIPGIGNLSPTRPPEAGGVPANGFDANGVWQQGPGQTIQGGEVPGGNLVNPSWQSPPQNSFAPIPPAPGYVMPVGTASQSSAYAAPTAADAYTNYTNPGWLSGGKYGRRGPGTPRIR